jgi:LysR family transcriptional regulator, glycine cleavage system transcriptional activator
MDRSVASIRTLSLGGLRAFEAASRLGSFKGAAEELCVTPAAISHRIKGLESQLGFLLFERLNRSLRLTRSGRSLALAVRRGFARIDTALADLASKGQGRSPAIISVSAAPSFATKWLAPRLHRFSERNPRFEVRLMATDALTDLARDPGVDMALRYGLEPKDDALYAERLWSEGVVVPVCAPSLAGKSGVSVPADLLPQRLLRTAAPASDGGVRAIGWAAWFERSGVATELAASAAAKGPMFSNTQLALEAAAAGQGFALAPSVLVEEDLRTRRLVRLFETTLPDPYSYWIVYRADRGRESGIAAFARWIKEEAAVPAI